MKIYWINIKYYKNGKIKSRASMYEADSCPSNRVAFSEGIETHDYYYTSHEEAINCLDTVKERRKIEK